MGAGRVRLCVAVQIAVVGEGASLQMGNMGKGGTGADAVREGVSGTRIAGGMRET